MARGIVFSGSRTSPLIFVTSHQPPKEKKAPTMAPPNAGSSGREPERWAKNGMKFDQWPRRKTKAQIVSRRRTPTFIQVRLRRKLALTVVLKVFSRASERTRDMATYFVAARGQSKIYAV